MKKGPYPVKIERGLMIPMRDGTRLSCDIYRPKEENETFPAIVVRSPYGKTNDAIFQDGCFFASHGYGYVFQDVRGRGDSEGTFVPYRHEADDGFDTIEAIARMPWCNGKIGTLGGSYLGRIQWLTALKKPPHLKTMIVSVTPSDPFVEWPTGLPNPQHLCWLYMTSGRVLQNVNTLNWESIYRHLPYEEMAELTGRDIPQWKNEISHPVLEDWWRKICYQDQFSQIDLPVFHISGWYDDEQIGTPLNYRGMRQNAATEEARNQQKLLMGPWPHQINRSRKVGEIDFGPQAVIDLQKRELRWYDCWLKGKSNGIREEKRVEIFVMGKNEWRKEDDWPLPDTNWTRFYIHSGGRANSRFGDGKLSLQKPGTIPGMQATTDTYEYDPNDPVPFITDMVSAQIGGPDDYRAIERRDDVLVYTTDPLQEDVEITGPVTMELFAATTVHDTDFMAKLLDVHPDGYAQRLCDGMIRGRFRNGMDQQKWLVPGEIYLLKIDLWNTSHVFEKGHAIRLEIASSAFPKYDRNLNTKTPLGKTKQTIVAKQTIYHDKTHPSALLLPVIRRM